MEILTLKEVAQKILDGETVYSGARDYHLGKIVDIDGKYKAYLSSCGFNYSNYELGIDHLDAIYKALECLQLMGRFANNRSDESIDKKSKKEKKLPKQTYKVNTSSNITTEQSEIEVPQEITDSIESILVPDKEDIESGLTPDEIETKIILKILKTVI